jgi:hypothetical protein
MRGTPEVGYRFAMQFTHRVSYPISWHNECLSIDGNTRCQNQFAASQTLVLEVESARDRGAYLRRGSFRGGINVLVAYDIGHILYAGNPAAGRWGCNVTRWI